MNVQVPQFLRSDATDMAGLGTSPIPAEPYYRPEFFELEREAIFRRTWLQIGHVSELPRPGTFIVRPVEVANASVLLTRGRDGAIRAFHNVCTHRGTQLVSEAEGARTSFTCPYHAWTFGNDGELRAAPDAERFYVDTADCALKKIAVDVCAGLIFINLAPSPKESLREFLGEMAEQLEALPVAKATTFSEYVYDIDANWKLTYDNFQENYHLRVVHPDTSGAGIGPDNPFGYPLSFGFFGPHRSQTIWLNPAATVEPIQGMAYGKLAEFAVGEGLGGLPANPAYLALFPNFFMLGSIGTPFSHTVMPISATRSRGVIRFYWVGDDDSASKRFAREYSTAAGVDIHSEDRAIIEAGQQGLNSGALKHIHFQEQEVLLRHFFQTVMDHVDAYRATLSDPS